MFWSGLGETRFVDNEPVSVCYDVCRGFFVTSVIVRFRVHKFRSQMIHWHAQTLHCFVIIRLFFREQEYANGARLLAGQINWEILPSRSSGRIVLLSCFYR